MSMADLFSLRGRIALVTGGTGGIGRMIAEGFLAHGATVYINSRKADACEATAAELGEHCHALPQDLSSVAGCTALAEMLGGRETCLDILVNNAGAAWTEDFETFPEHGWDRVMDLNVKSPFFLAQKLHPLLRRAGEGGCPAKIINIGSIDGLRPNPWETYSYHASKAAILYLTRRLAARLIRDNIVVNAIAPGPFPSRMNRAARDHADVVAALVPNGRVGTAEDIAGAAVYLASRAGDYVVGETIAVDGGLAHAFLGEKILEH